MAGWKRLAKATADGTSSTLSVSFDANDVIRLQVYAENTSGAGNFQIRFNNDTTANRHKTRRVYDGAGSGSDRYADTSSNKFISYSATSALQSYMIIDVHNIDNEEHLVMGNCVESGATGAGSSGVPHTVNWMGKYTEKTPQVTSVQLITNSNNLNDKSYIIVLTTADNVVSDEKQTLADATRTESATVTLSDDFSSDNFTNVGGQSGWGVSGGTMAWTTHRSTTHQGEYRALPSTVTGDFVLRFKLTNTTIAYDSSQEEYLYIGLSNSNSCASNTNQNVAGMYFHNYSSSDSKIQVTYRTNTSPFSGTATSIDFGENTTYYVEISKSDDTVTLKLFSDEDYSTLMSGGTATSTSGGASDQYTHIVLMGMYHSNAGSTSALGTIDDIKFYNGVSSAADTTVSTAPNAGTQYRETDTRKIYRWNDNKDITNGLKALYEWSNSGDVSNTATGSDSIGSAGNLGATNSASHSTSVKKIGTASGHFPNDSSYSKTSTSNGANFDFTGDSTVTLWVRRIDGLDSDYHAMVSKRSGSSSEYNLYLAPVSSGVSKAYVYITAGGSTTNVATDSGIPDSTWTHIAVTISGSVLKFYINGSLDATRDVTSGSKGTISQPFGLGAISGSGTEGFQGYLDQVSIWNRALTAGEVSKIYNGGDGVADLNALTDKGWVERGSA